LSKDKGFFMKNRLLFILVALLAVSGFAETQGTLVDKRDGKKYKTVKIGDQTWMAENLNYEADSSFCYNNEESNCAKYGRLYKWNAAMKACPAGWHLPSKAEWETVFTAAGGKEDGGSWTNAGKVLRSSSGWVMNRNGSDLLNFSALPAGVRMEDEKKKVKYTDETAATFFWSSVDKTGPAKFCEDLAYIVYLNYNSSGAGLYGDYKRNGLSVRCVKD
jgi:uncharacterized protein (TIGR02145 family)